MLIPLISNIADNNLLFIGHINLNYYSHSIVAGGFEEIS